MFLWRNKKNISNFSFEKRALSGAMGKTYILSPAVSKKSGGTLFLVFRGAWRVVRGSEFLVGTLSP